MKQRLTELIAAPEKAVQENMAMLEDLVKEYPYFQPAHVMLAKAAMADDKPGKLARAALYTNGQLLYNYIHEPEFLISASFNVIPLAKAGQTANEPDNLDQATIDEVASSGPELITDDQEVFEEIGEVNISEYQHYTFNNKPEPAEQEIQAEKETLEENLVLENIVSTDFFAFQDNFQVEPISEIPAQQDPVIEEYKEASLSEDEESIVVSKYDDDNLPYTFLWWLAKTRKEHQQIFQPYASPKQNKNDQKAIGPEQKNPPELQQQYVEHIFHIQSPFDEQGNDYSAIHLKPAKGSEIIENFIRNEPQISPPKPEQLNNENKARKSAEDHNDLVSETLAKIYIEQMLYDKAIETYEKLSLKFPEKSRYFADLIQSIEKKI